MKIYIVGKLPFKNIKAEHILEILKSATKHNILWFGSYNKRKIEQFKDALQDIEFSFRFFNLQNISSSLREIKNCNIFYFLKQCELTEFQEFLYKKSINETCCYFIGLEEYPPEIIILKKKNRYYKLLTIQRGYDDLFYFVFNGEYETYKLFDTKSLLLPKIKNKFYSPYICYHRTGVVNSKDCCGNYFIPTIKIKSLKEIFGKNAIYQIFTLISHLNFENLKEMSITSSELKLFNYIEVNQGPLKMIKKGITKETFIVVDVDLIEENEDLYLEFWLHKKEIKDSMLDLLEDYQKTNIFNNLTMDNKFSQLCYTILFKESRFKGADSFNGLILSLVGKRNFYVCSLNKVI